MLWAYAACPILLASFRAEEFDISSCPGEMLVTSLFKTPSRTANLFQTMRYVGQNRAVVLKSKALLYTGVFFFNLRLQSLFMQLLPFNPPRNSKSSIITIKQMKQAPLGKPQMSTIDLYAFCSFSAPCKLVSSSFYFSQDFAYRRSNFKVDHLREF